MKNPQFGAKRPWLRCIGVGLAAAMTVVATTGATEEANEADDDDDYIEEIVVTATYRETAELDTPVSMGTVSGDLIEDTGALDFNDIAHLVSGLAYSGQNESENAISIRGVSDGSVRGESYSVTSVYYDDAPVSGVTSPGRHGSGTAFDMERVEVLMGPQGVLGGAGNIAGLVRFVTKKPELNAWRAKTRPISNPSTAAAGVIASMAWSTSRLSKTRSLFGSWDSPPTRPGGSTGLNSTITIATPRKSAAAG